MPPAPDLPLIEIDKGLYDGPVLASHGLEAANELCALVPIERREMGAGIGAIDLVELS